jgi:pteridine reductase
VHSGKYSTMRDAAVLVTGGAKRVGAAIVRTLHDAGARVVIHCFTSRGEAQALATALNARRPASAAIVQGDLADTGALAALVEDAASRFGRLDGLVNNASGFRSTPFATLAPADWEELSATNLRAPMFLAKAAAPHLSRAGGAIVNIVDIHAERPLKDFAAYTVAKAGLAGLTRSLALELAPDVRVNGVSPGAILWPEPDDAFPPGERARITAQTPLRRTGRPEDIAGAVKYLLLDAPYVTGQILAVDGGRSIAL